MIKKYWGITLLCFTLLTNSGIAQDLSYLEKKAENTNTWEDKISLYLQIADSAIWVGSNIHKSKEYAEKVLELCEEKNCGDFTLAAYTYLAEYEINRTDYTTVKEVIIPKLEKGGFKSNIIEARFEEIAGTYFIQNGYTSKAIYHLTRSQNILEKEKPKSKQLSTVYYNLAFSYNINGKNDSSIFFMRKSITHAKSINDELKLIEALSGICTLYSSDGKDSEAIKALLESIEIMNNNPLAKYKKYHLYGSLVNLYIKNEYYEKAKKELLHLIPELRTEQKSITEKAADLWSLNMSMSKLLGRMDEPEKGLIYTDSAYVYAHQLNPFTVLITDLRRASLNLKAGHYELAKEQFEQLVKDSKVAGRIDAFNAVLVGQFANLYTQSSVKPSKIIVDNFLPVVDRIIKKNENQFNLDLLDAQRLSTILGVYNQDQSRVVNGLQQILAIKDTLQNQEKLKVTNEFFVKYQTKEQEKELEINALALTKKTTQRNALIGAALALLIIVTVLALYYQQKKKYATTLEYEVEKRTTDLKAANKALLQSNEELERYTYIASHDLKEPLRNIVSFVNLLKRKKMVENEDALEYFDFIEKGAVQMNRIVQDVLEFSELRNLNPTIETTVLPQIIENVKEVVSKQFDDRIIILKTDNFPNEIESNEALLFMIFKNIIENGVKYNQNPVVNISIVYTKIDNLHQFKIQDNGIGIDEKYFKVIFKMFKRLHNRSEYNGSGIGLAICKRSVEYLNGTINLESKREKGSTFIVEFPIVS